MGKGAPKAPDPKVVAQAQADANIQTAQTQTGLNRYDQVNPFGSSTWSQDPNNPNKYTQSTQYDPKIMAAIDQNMSLAGSNAGQQIAKNQFATELGNRNADILRQAPGQVPGVDQARDFINIANNRLTDNTNNVKSSQGVALTGDQALNNAINRVNTQAGTAMNFDSAPDMPQANEATRQNVSNAVYDRATARLDPRFQQSQDNLDAKLAAQGITQGSPAYDRAMQNMSMERNDAYSSAQNDAEIGSADAMSKLFSQQLAARQQGVGETQAIRDQTGKEALIAGNLAGTANTNLNNNLQSQISRGVAIPTVANGLMDTMSQGYNNENNQRNQALNEYNSLTQGNGNNTNPLANIPGFDSGSGGAGQVGQTPVADSTYASYQGNMNKYAQNVGSMNNLISGGAGIAAAAVPLLM